MKRITAVIALHPNRKLEILDSLEKNNIPFIIERGFNPSENRNRGASKVKTDFIAFLDAHSIITDNWVEEIEKFFLKYPEIDIVGGPQLTPEGQGLFARISGYALSSFFGAATMRNRYKITKVNLDANETYLTSSNLACKREVLEKVQFDPTRYPGEDPKFINDSKKEGFKVAYSPEIVIRHKRRESLTGLISQIFNYGSFRPKMGEFKEILKKPFFVVPSLFLVYLVALPILAVMHKIFLIPLLLYLVIAFLFSIYEGINNKNFLALFLLPPLFLMIHLSYGVGYICGFFKKR